MFRLALRMLFGDHAKYLMLLSGILFSTLLMAQGASLFCGLMSWMFSTLSNVRAPVWVADPKVEQVNDNKPLRDTDVMRVRSVEGVAWAVPLYQGNNQARMPDGTFKLTTLVGLDATTLIGAPPKMVAGSLEDLRLPNTVIIDEFGVERFSVGFHNEDGTPRNIRLGDVFEMNDREARVVGICKAHRSFTGGPYVFTTYDRAMQYAPNQRKMMTYVLAAPMAGISPEELARKIEKELGYPDSPTGLRAFTENEFMWSTVWWYVINTGIPINVGILVLIGFIVGTVISGQTFYSFVIENTRNLAALKAMGTGNLRLTGMLVLQALSVGAIGYGLGIGAVSLLGRQLLRLGKVPFLMLWQIPVGVAAAVLLISGLAALLGVLHIARVQPALVFR